MSPVLEATPIGTQAAILHRVISEPYPKQAMGTIAANFGLTMVDLQAILNAHGYPSIERMKVKVRQLADEAAADQHTPDEPTERPEADSFVRVPVNRILADPDNIRDELRDIEDLADSIKEVGLLQPIVVRRSGKQLVVLAGHRRLAAVRHLKWTDVQVIVKTEMRPDHVLAAMLIENGQRSDLDPIEEARGLAKLKAQTGCSDLELARRVGRSQPVISARLALLSLSAEEQREVRAGTMRLVEAAHRGRMNSGKVKAPGQDKGWALGPAHDLADRVKARCQRLNHPKGRSVGGMGCGACWESVIRADERTQLIAATNAGGPCPTCGGAE